MATQRQQVLSALRAVIDPDLHEDIVQLGFVKNLVIEGEHVRFEVELTTPACPVKEQLQEAARAAVEALEWVDRAEVTMTARTRGAAVQRATGAAMGGVQNILAIASGKGGVGKSTTAVNVAWALARRGASVGILDADVYGPSISHMTGADIPSELDELKRSIPPMVDGIKVVSMAMFVPAKRPMMLRGPRVTAILQQFVAGFSWGELDYLLVDMPPGTGDAHITLTQLLPLTGVLLVTTPQEVAVLDSRRAATMFSAVNVPVLGVVETMSGFRCGACDALHPIFEGEGGATLARELNVDLLGQIPLDPQVVVGGERARPVVVDAPNAPASEAYEAVAEQLIRRLAVRNVKADGALDHFELVWDSEGGHA